MLRPLVRVTILRLGTVTFRFPKCSDLFLFVMFGCFSFEDVVFPIKVSDSGLVESNRTC